MKRLVLYIVTLLLATGIFFVSSTVLNAQCSPGDNCCTCDKGLSLSGTCPVNLDDDNCDTGFVPTCNSSTIACSQDPTCTCSDSEETSCGQEGLECCQGGGCDGSLECLSIGYGYTRCLSPCSTNDDCGDNQVCSAFDGCINDPFTNEEYDLAIFCTSANGDQTNVFSEWMYTAVGCIPVQNNADLTVFFLRRGLSIAGGIALLLLSFGGLQIMTAQSDPRRYDSGRRIVTAAISGLLFIFLAILLIRLLGVTVFEIPGLS